MTSFIFSKKEQEFNKRSVPIKRTVSCNWNQRVPIRHFLLSRHNFFICNQNFEKLVAKSNCEGKIYSKTCSKLKVNHVFPTFLCSLILWHVWHSHDAKLIHCHSHGRSATVNATTSIFTYFQSNTLPFGCTLKQDFAPFFAPCICRQASKKFSFQWLVFLEMKEASKEEQS